MRKQVKGVGGSKVVGRALTSLRGEGRTWSWLGASWGKERLAQNPAGGTAATSGKPPEAVGWWEMTLRATVRILDLNPRPPISFEGF